MADFLKDVGAGQAVGPVFRDSKRINAWNLAARQALRSGEIGAGGALDTRLASQVTVMVRNDTAANLPDFAVVKLASNPRVTAEVLADPDKLAQVARDTREQPFFSGVLAPVGETMIAILEEPIKKGAVGRATMQGVTSAFVQVTNSAHLFAGPTQSDPSKLTSATSGPARIITKRATGTGLMWADVLLDRTAVPPFSGARAGLSANLSIPNVTATPVTWTGTNYDTENYWNASQPTLFTVPQTGFYLLEAEILFAGAAGGVRTADMYPFNLDNIRRGSSARVVPSDAGEVPLTLCAVGNMTVGMTCFINVQQSSGAALDIIYDAATHFTITRLG